MRTAARIGALASSLLVVLASGGCTASPDERVTLTLLTGTVDANVRIAHAVVDAFNESQSDVVVAIDSSVPSGAEGDGVIRTRLATGDMPDLFWHETGAQLRALEPDQTLLDLSDEPWVDLVEPAFIETVSTRSGVYGAPVGTMSGGGFLYWIPAYEELGLDVPRTWEEFIRNAHAIDRAGMDAVLQSYGDAWTAQVLVLADFYNVQAADANWAVRYTARETGYGEPPALSGFEHLAQLHDEDLLNRDAASLTFSGALERLASGEGVHYPMLTFALQSVAALHPESLDDIGYFPIPGDGPLGATVWLPPAIYAPSDTPHPDEVRAFLAYLASPEACEATMSAITPTGPPVVTGCTLPVDAPRATSDLGRFLAREDGWAPALEFVSPVKGTALEQIAVEVGSGIRGAGDGARLYDLDVEKYALQFGDPR